MNSYRELSKSDPRLLVVDADRCRQLLAIIDYVEGIHHHIDPDMYDIAVSDLQKFRSQVESDDDQDRHMFVSYRDILILHNIVMAAETYSARRGYFPVDGVDEEDFDAILRWLEEAEDCLFRSAPRVF